MSTSLSNPIFCWLISHFSFLLFSTVPFRFYYDVIFSSESDKRNKPSIQLSLEKIKQSAAQTWCLLRMLPFLIGDYIDLDDPYWQLYLKLRDVVDLCFAPALTAEATYTMEGVIKDHHEYYLEVILISNWKL